MEFAGRPFRVLLLESGGLESDAETQSLYKGNNVGLPYFPLDICRLRRFGGTTNHWGGTCRPFDEIDFEPREWIPYSGWPFPKSVIDPFYKRALPIVQLHDYEWAPEFWAETDKPPLPLAGGRAKTRVTQEADYRLRRFGRTYRDKVTQAANITTCLHAILTQIHTNRAIQNATRLRVAALS